MSSLGGRFQGRAVFSLLGLGVVLVLMAALVLLATIGLGPDHPGSLGPVPMPPRFEAAVSDADALGAGVNPAVGRRVVVASSAPAKASPKRPQGGANAAPTPTVGPARAVTVAAVPAAPQPEPAGEGPQAPSDGATAVEAPPEGASGPVVTPVPGTGGSGTGGPIAAGGPVIESCEGDEYVITIVLSPEATEDEEASVEIVIKKLDEGGSVVEEVKLEGSLLDAQNLAVQLASEGNCVHLEAGPAAGGEVPSDGTSTAVVPAEGTSPPASDPDSTGDPVIAPDAP